MSTCSATPEICAFLATIERDAYIIQLTKLMGAASMMVYIYDFFLTYDDEVGYMWKAGFGLGKIVYFAIRYLTLKVMLLINISNAFLPIAAMNRLLKSPQFCSYRVLRMNCMFCCARIEVPVYSEDNLALPILARCLTWIRFHWVTGVMIGLLTEIPLLLRIYALYNKNRMILIFTITCLVATAISMMGIAGTAMHTEGAVMAYLGPASDMRMCVPTNLPSAYRFFWIPLLGNEFILLSLALMKWVQNCKCHGMQHSSINEMVKGSILYFVSTFTFFLFSHLTWVIGDEKYIELPVGLAISMGGIMSQRLLLDVRKYHNRQVVDRSWKHVESQLRFARNVAITGSSIEMGGIRRAKLDGPMD